MPPSATRLERDRLTWLVYILYGLYGALINALGPAISGLRADLRLTHTEAGLHSSLFAVGMIVAGFGGDALVRRIGRYRGLWVAAVGAAGGTLVLVLGPTLPLTLLGALVMGTAGSLMLVLVPAILSDRHGAHRSSAFSEANSIASGLTVVVPVVVGLSIAAGLGWRPALLGVGILAVPVLAVFGRGVRVPEPGLTRSTAAQGRLPAAFWLYWMTIVMVVSVEFCMIYWVTDYVRSIFGLEPAISSAALTLFLVGMVVGRATGSRVLLRSSAAAVLPIALLLTAVAFVVFWLSPIAPAALAGVLLTGLGVSTLYPMSLSLAVASAVATTDAATSRAALASGSAVLGGPLILAALADRAGIQAAFAVVPVLLGLAGATVVGARRLEAAQVHPRTQLG